MYALTIHNPWVWLIAHGIKTVENRTWKASRVLGQRIAVHASCREYLIREDLDYLDAHHPRAVKRLPAELPTGCVLATALVAAFVTESDDPWFEGPVGWMLADVKLLKRPIYCRGAQGLWILKR